MTTIVGWENNLATRAPLVIDGEEVAARKEEPFARVKQQTGLLSHSVDRLLADSGIAIDKVEECSYGSFAGRHAEALPTDLTCRAASRGDELIVVVMRERPRTEQRRTSLGCIPP